MTDKTYTRREYLERKAMLIDAESGHVQGLGGLFLVKEAVATTLLEHPELDPDEVKTWDGWESHA